MRRLWALRPNGFADADTFANSQLELAVAGLGAGEVEGAAQSLSELVVAIGEPDAVRRAVAVWRRQGVVVFPSLLNHSLVDALRAEASAVLHADRATATDRTSHIRSPSSRQLRALPVARSSAPLEVLASELSQFLDAVGQDTRQLVLEMGAMRAAPPRGRAGLASRRRHP